MSVVAAVSSWELDFGFGPGIVDNETAISIVCSMSSKSKTGVDQGSDRLVVAQSLWPTFGNFSRFFTLISA